MNPLRKLLHSLSMGLLLAAVAAGAWLSAPAQEYTFLTLAGPPDANSAVDGPGNAARFWQPSGVAVDGAGNVYVADSANYVIRKVSPTGEVTTLAGLAGCSGRADGPGSAARFSGPFGLALDSAGNLYVGDSPIRKITPDGVVTTVLDNRGNQLAETQTALAIDSAGNLYAASPNQPQPAILKMTPDGAVTTLTNLPEQSPGGLAVDGQGNLYLVFLGQTLVKITPGGVATTLANGLAGLEGAFCGVAVDAAGNVYVPGNSAIFRVTPDGTLSTFAGQAGKPGWVDGTGSAAQFNAPCGLALDSAANLYVADNYNSTIRKITPAGVVTTLAGLAGGPGKTDGAREAAHFSNPEGLALDSAGNLYVADAGNALIRQVTPAGLVSTVAGPAGFGWPSAVALDGAGNLYVADSMESSLFKITPGGSVITLGSGNQSFNQPHGVAADNAGNVYVADTFNYVIRKVTPDGTVTTLAGTVGSAGQMDGAGGEARFMGPMALALDAQGDLWVADDQVYNSGWIRRVTPGGVVTTLSDSIAGEPVGLAPDAQGTALVTELNGNTAQGNMVQEFTPAKGLTTLAGLAGVVGSADGSGSAAGFNAPYGIVVDEPGTVYVADSGNGTIRVGRIACPDRPTIDLAVAPLGSLRQLDTSPQTAVAWQWTLIRRPTASTALPSNAGIRNPTFTPDVPDLYTFQLQATNAAGDIAISTLTLAAGLPPAIVTPPQNQAVPAGAFVSFSLTVTNFPPVPGYGWALGGPNGGSVAWPGLSIPPEPGYAWLFNGSNAVGGLTNYVLGLTNVVLVLSNVQPAQAGAYSVVVSNAYGAATSAAATLTVQRAAPILLTLLTNQTIMAGTPVEFRVSAVGALPLTYRWFFNGTNAIAGATNDLLDLVDPQLDSAGAYTVTVTDAYGALTNSTATLNVAPAGTVMLCTEDSLLAAIAAGRGKITFASDGVITLSTTLINTSDLLVDGTGRQVTISGGNTVGVLCVVTNVTFTARNLTIANGFAPAGAGILNQGGTLNLEGVAFQSNVAVNFTSLSAGPQGGALCNQGGTVNATNCLFSDNLSTNDAVESFAQGGALYSAGGRVNLSGCRFTGNLVTGRLTAEASGGALWNSGPLAVTACSFFGNSALGGPTAEWSYPNNVTASAWPGGDAGGGAIYNSGTNGLSIDQSVFTTNSATAGWGEDGGRGADAPPWFPFGNPSGGNGGDGAAGGNASGGAIFAVSSASIVNCTFAANSASAGSGGVGGIGGSGPGGQGANGADGPGGSADGGAMSGPCWATNCTLAGNWASAGAGPHGGGASGSASGGGVNGGTLVNTLLAADSPADSFTNGGYNLSSATTAGLIGPLADNGGPTLTMALLPGSPALDAANTAWAPSTDQRGWPRPMGPGADVGAYEAGAPIISSPPLDQSNEVGFAVSFSVTASGYPPLAYQWVFNATNPLAGATNPVLTLTNIQLAQSGAYTVVVTNQFGAVTSSPAILAALGAPPLILAPPQTQTACLDSPVEFSVTAAGSTPLSYQWCFNAANTLAYGPNPVLQLTNVQLSQAGAYTVAVSNAFGSVTSPPATLTVLATPPVIVAPPVSQTLWLGSSNSFQGAASGCPPLAYQWFFNATNAIPDATNTLLWLTNLQPSQAGDYSLVVTNPRGAVTSAVAALTLVNPVVTNATEAALRTALAFGGTIDFATSGTITLASTVEITRDTVLDATGQQVAISGGNAVRVFLVDTNVHLALTNLTVANGCVANGWNDDWGAGLYNDGGQVVLEQCRFINHAVRGCNATPVGPASGAGGGAIYNAGTLAAHLCAFSGNSAQGGTGVQGDTMFPTDVSASPGGPASGGALFNTEAAVATISESSFVSNSVAGGIGGTGAWGQPGWTPGSIGSYATDGAAGAEADGGAIYNGGTLLLVSTTCAGNTAAGGPGGQGGGSSEYGAANGAAAGPGNGGVVYNSGTASLVNSTFTENTSIGGAGGPGGSSQGSAGNGGNGGAGIGGVTYGPCYATNCTLVANWAIGGAGGLGGTGGPSVQWDPTSPPVRGANGETGPADCDGDWNAFFVNSLLAANSPPDNSPGGPIDSSNNLWANTTAGIVGPLADNGGPTLTMSLPPGSPAIDAADTSLAPPTDQRGFPRPFGAAADIGAYEFGYAPLTLSIARSMAGEFTIQIQGDVGLSCRLLTSTTFTNWVPVATNSIGAEGSFTLQVAPGGAARRFYRVISP